MYTYTRLLLLTIPFVLTASVLERPAWGQSSNGSNSATANSPAQESAPDPGAVDPGSIDDLLKLADKDVGQLSQVHTTGKTGSASLDMPVSTVARQESTVGKSPAAVFVITNEMIHRSGAVNIPDVLRMAPGIEVAQISSDEWAISARGFSNLFSNKLLVQIDGRTVYDLFFGGVVWDVQDVMLEDVERIEVIRGPGATIWGSNAVNGVINIITKKAQDTQGLLVQGGAGSHERDYANARVGGRIGQDMYFRVYGKSFDRGPSYLEDGSFAPDAWHQGRCGFRMDYDASRSDAMTLQGDYYDGRIATIQAPTIPVNPFFLPSDAGRVDGENILYRWKHTIDDDTDWTFQAYYDRTERHYFNPVYGPDRDLVDTDFQHRFPLGARNEIIWGCGYRFTQDTFQDAPFYINLNPVNRFDNYFSFFLQDQITLAPDRWYFTVGSKFEYNDYTNFEYQPTGRLLWTPDERHSIWGAVSRAVHVPTRQSDDVQVRLRPIGSIPFPPFPDPLPLFPMAFGNRNLQSEELLAWEFGFREQATERFSWDLAMFYNQYDKLSASLPSGIRFDPPAYFILPTTYVNGGAGETYGIELAANYQASDRWRMQFAYTYLRMFIHVEPGSLPDLNLYDSPVNQVYFQSSWDIGNHWQYDLIGRYVDVLSGSAIPKYVVMDMRLAWLGRKNLEVAVVGRNLFNGYYPEFSTVPMSGVGVTEVGPQVYGQVTWRY